MGSHHRPISEGLARRLPGYFDSPSSPWAETPPAQAPQSSENRRSSASGRSRVGQRRLIGTSRTRAVMVSTGPSLRIGARRLTDAEVLLGALKAERFVQSDRVVVNVGQDDQLGCVVFGGGKVRGLDDEP